MKPTEAEERRRLALKRYGLLDTAPEAIFDGITLAIANICQVPIALVSLVDSNRQWFKSAYGLQVGETPRDIAFCDHAIQRPNELMVVEDAVADPRFHDNPLVIDYPHIRFYAGKPIVTNDGHAIGTLCVIDRKPRSLERYQLEALNALSSSVAAILEERRRLQAVAIDQDDMGLVLNEHVMRYQQLFRAAEALLRGVLNRSTSPTVVINVAGEVVSFNEAWNEFGETMSWDLSAVGESYLHQQLQNFSLSPQDMADVREKLESVLNESSDGESLEFPSSNGRWKMSIEPILRPVKGALIQHNLSESAAAANSAA